jgi:hypothetical protein
MTFDRTSSQPPDLLCIEVQGPADLPAWMRRAFVDADGNVFLPVAAANRDETMLVLCASFDGIEVERHDGHVYFPSGWLIQECPDSAADIHAIVGNMLKHAGGKP